MYGLIWLTDLKSKIDSIDLLTMLTSAVCHDLDHTGYNNAYQVSYLTILIYLSVWLFANNTVTIHTDWHIVDTVTGNRRTNLWLRKVGFMLTYFMLICQINARTELALRYNDISPLENHHCAVAFEILEKVSEAGARPGVEAGASAEGVGKSSNE